jgi:hypothetical protein
MALLGIFTKQPAEVLDYDISYKDLLSRDGDEIESANVTVTPEMGVQPTWTINGDRVKVWVAGGTDGVTYRFEVTTTTKMGRVKQDEFRIRYREV